MNKISQLLFLFFSLNLAYSVQAQAPESMNYQAVIRDGSGDLVASQSVGIRIIILQGNASGTNVYEETYAIITDAYGLVNLQLGTGTVQSGTFSSIDWGNGPYFVETAVDVAGGTSYNVISITQFMSVPYALHANVADSLVGYQPSQQNELPSGSIIISEEPNDTALINRGFSISGVSEQTIIPVSGSNHASNDSSIFYNWEIIGLSTKNTTPPPNTSYRKEDKSSILFYQDKIYIVHERTGKIITVELSSGNFNELSIPAPNFACGESGHCTYKSSLCAGNDFYLYGGFTSGSN